MDLIPVSPKITCLTFVSYLEDVQLNISSDGGYLLKYKDHCQMSLAITHDSSSESIFNQYRLSHTMELMQSKGMLLFSRGNVSVTKKGIF